MQAMGIPVAKLFNDIEQALANGRKMEYWTIPYYEMVDFLCQVIKTNHNWREDEKLSQALLRLYELLAPIVEKKTED